MASLAEISPYIYMATVFFVLSACTSDLLMIRVSLIGGFCGLVLAALSGHDPNGSFDYIPLSDGIVDITMLINMVLFVLNVYISVRLVRDEMPKTVENEDAQQLFYFFEARCRATHVEFQHIYKHGQFLNLKQDEELRECRSRLYLVIQGKVKCCCKFSDIPTTPFIKRSGEFFDLRMFNFFTFPIGFDNTEFQAKTLMDTKLFYWDVNGIQAMSQVPLLNQFWSFVVLRSLAASAVRHHLKKTDTLYDSLSIPEEEGWLNGETSRDFSPHTRRPTLLRQIQRICQSFQVIPPHGVRHRPGILEQNEKVEEQMDKSTPTHYLSTKDTAVTEGGADSENQLSTQEATETAHDCEVQGIDQDDLVSEKARSALM